MTIPGRRRASHQNSAAPWVLFIAQGFGSGRIRPAPGSWGTVVGLAWTWVLMATQSQLLFIALALLGIGVAVPLCGRAARLLGETDPSSVVLDEIVATPLIFTVPMALNSHLLGTPGQLPSARALFWWGCGFVAFRVFDIVKPNPIDRLQALPGGWGIVADDLAAAVAAAGTLELVRRIID